MTEISATTATATRPFTLADLKRIVAKIKPADMPPLLPKYIKVDRAEFDRLVGLLKHSVRPLEREADWAVLVCIPDEPAIAHEPDLRKPFEPHPGTPAERLAHAKKFIEEKLG